MGSQPDRVFDALRLALRSLRAWERWAGVRAEDGPGLETVTGSAEAVRRVAGLGACRHPRGLDAEILRLPCAWPDCPDGTPHTMATAWEWRGPRVVDGVQVERGGWDRVRFVRSRGEGWSWVQSGAAPGRRFDGLSDEEIRRRRRRGARRRCARCGPDEWHAMVAAGGRPLAWTLAEEPAGHEPLEPWSVVPEDE